MGNAPTKGVHPKNRGHKKYVHWDQAVPPWPPGKPHLVPGSPNSQTPDFVTIRWDPPPDDGGAPITGYLVEHRKSGTPHWVRSTRDLVLEPELKLFGLEPGWRYQFRVTAENAADLLSDPGEISQPLTVARAYKPATMAPQFSLELKNVLTLENEKVEFLVNFHGIPTPKISWYKDSFEIFSTRRMRVSTEQDTSSLVIFQAAFSDEGEYKCTATNRAGHILTKATLRLEAPPCIRIPRQYEDGLLFEKDEVIRLKVSVAGRPLPRVSWYHNSEPIPFGGRYEVQNTEKFSGLRISEARRSDRGEYQVRATSRLGEDIVAFLVTVTDRPMPPGRPKVASIVGRSVTLTWSEPDDDGGCKIGNYIVEYYRLGWNVWLKAATCRQVTTTLGDLIEGSEYKFRVKAENPYGVSDASEETDATFIPDPKRGLLVRGSRSQSDIPMPDQLAETKRGRSKDSLMARDQEIRRRKEEELKRMLPEKDLKVKKMKSEEFRKKDDRRSTTPLERSETPRREKRSVEFLPQDGPEIVKRKKKPSSERLDIESVKKAREHKNAPPAVKSEKGMKASLQFSVAKRRESSGERDSGVSEGSFTTGSKQSFTSPLHPREDDSLLHGSSELMLVLLPQSEEQQGGKESERHADLSIFGECSVPPPMSLSAPELGGGEQLVTHPLRNSVSSTELLHEQAMARFYQAVAEEEAEKAIQRKENMERRSAEPTTMESRRRSFEINDVQMKEISRKIQSIVPEELPWQQKKQNIFQDTKEISDGVSSLKKPTLQPEIHLKSIVNRKEPVQLSTKEEEEAIFDRVRQKTSTPQETPKPPEKTPRSILRNRVEDTIPKHYEAKPIEVKEVEVRVELEDEGMQEDDYPENEELDGEECLEEENSEFDEEEELYKRIEEVEENYHPNSEAVRRFDRFAEEEEEEETYHPRNMIPKSPPTQAPIVRTLERQLTPRPSNDVPYFPKSILKSNNTSFQQQLEEMVERPRNVIPRELERSPPKSFRENHPKELLPQFSSDTGSRSPSPLPRSPSPPPESPLPLSPSPPRDSPEPELQFSTTPEPEMFSPPRVSPSPLPFSPTPPESPEPEFYMAEEGQEGGRHSGTKVHSRIETSVPETKTYWKEPVIPPEMPQVSETNVYWKEPVIPPEKPEVPNTEIPSPQPTTITPQPVPEPPKPTISSSIVPEPTISAAEAARQRRMQIRKLSIEEDFEEKRAMADHYGEIIRDNTRPKRTSKRYTTISEMKIAAAEAAARRREKLLMTPEPTRSPTPEPEPEPEPEFNELSPEQQNIVLEQSAYDRYTAPAPRSPTPTGTRTPRRTPDLVLIRSRQSSKDRTRMPSTERFAAELSKRFPEVARRFSPERTVEQQPKPVEELPPLRPITPKLELPREEVAESRMRFYLNYFADLAMFLVACWLYVFKDERYAIPIIILLIYRQLYQAIKRKLPKLPQLPWKRSSES
ncbi:hypothetical protein C0J52_23697 [Blattella germanica]|nr:hypothetical protein C0J52_23697 [Blattella germanica]